MVKVHYGEGVATHTGPESCAWRRETRAAPAGPTHPRKEPASRRGRAKSRETWTLRWREADSNHQSLESGDRHLGRMISCSR
jgi:hypothetical protein